MEISKLCCFILIIHFLSIISFRSFLVSPVYISDLILGSCLIFFVIFVKEYLHKSLFFASVVFIALMIGLRYDDYHSAYALQALCVSYCVFLVYFRSFEINELRLLGLFSFVILIFSILAYARIDVWLPLEMNVDRLFGGVFLQENANMCFMSLCFFLILYLILIERNRIMNLFWIFCLFVDLIGCFLAIGSKGGWLSLLIGISIMLFLPIYKKHTWNKRIYFHLTFLSCLLFVAIALFIYVMLTSENISITSRKQLWSGALWMLWHHPFGVGLGEFSFYWDSYLKFINAPNVSGTVSHPESAHSFYLCAFSELGYLGGVIVLVFTLWPLVRLLKNYLECETQEYPSLIFLISSYITLLVAINIETFAWTQPSIRAICWAFYASILFYSGLGHFGIPERFYFIGKVLKLIVLLIIITSQVIYGRFLYSEYLLKDYGSKHEIRFPQIQQVLSLYPFSAPAQWIVIDMNIKIQNFNEAKKRITLLKSISGMSFDPELLEYKIASAQKDTILMLGILEERLLYYPKSSLNLYIDLLNIYAKRKKCDQFIFLKNNVNKIYPFKKFENPKLLNHFYTPYIIWNKKTDSLIVNEIQIDAYKSYLYESKLISELGKLECE